MWLSGLLSSLSALSVSPLTSFGRLNTASACDSADGQAQISSIARLGTCVMSIFNCGEHVATRVHLPAASGNDYQKERQFKKINSQKDSIEVPAVRSGKQIVLKNTDVLVGDVLLLNTGDKVTSTDATLSTHAYERQSCLKSIVSSTAHGSYTRNTG